MSAVERCESIADWKRENMVFGFFGGSKDARRTKMAEKYGNVLKNKVTTKEQRLEAIDALLSEDDAALVIPQLMKRFEIVVDSGIQDKREKEMCAEKIVSFKETAIPFVEQAVKSSPRPSWPLQMAEELLDREAYLVLLLDILKLEISAFDDAARQRNVEVIMALAEHSDVRVVEHVSTFLNERDEDLRMAALQCLERQARELPAARDIICGLLNLEESDDNSRFLGIVRTLIVKNSWGSPATSAPS
jgi:hypothetical protein